MPETLSLFLLGLLYGTTVCSLSCVPYLGPYLLGTGNGFGDGIKTTLAFGAGKIVSYSALAGLAGFLGQSLTPGANWGRLSGALLVAIGLALPLFAVNKTKSGCCRAMRGGPSFLLGITTSLVPCPPLAAILVLAADGGSLGNGLLFGLAYGTGLALSPMLLLGGGLAFLAGRIGQEAASIKPFMHYSSMALLVMLGIKNMLL